MQLTIRGQNTHLLECTGSESIAELKVCISHWHCIEALYYWKWPFPCGIV